MLQNVFFRTFTEFLYKSFRAAPALVLAGALSTAPCGVDAALAAGVKTSAPAAKKKTAPAPRKVNKAAASAAKTAAPPSACAGFPVSRALEIPPELAARLPVAESWKPLMERLAGDGLESAYLRALFGRLGETYSHVPMGTKINELYANKYTPRPPRKGAASATPPVYKSLLAPAVAERCREYLLQHAVAFGAMEAAYGVPREIVVALLMVETRLGAFLGRNSALWSLACLAAADNPDRISPTLSALEITQDRLAWVEQILRERSAWAYKELLALMRHSRAHGLDPLSMPGSVYGAIGLCQFMPSNLPKFAVDGDKDGKIDLFNPADAIPSVANYLKRHGWEKSDKTAQHKTLMRYNKSRVYANTILALADALAAPEKAPLPPRKKTAQKTSSATTAAKKTPGKNSSSKSKPAKP